MLGIKVKLYDTTRKGLYYPEHVSAFENVENAMSYYITPIIVILSAMLRLMKSPHLLPFAARNFGTKLTQKPI